MSRSIRSVRATVAASAGAGAIGIVLFTAVAPAGGSSPTSEPSGATAVETSGLESTASGPPAFVDGQDARLAAEELLGTYIESEFGYTVTDAACSAPATGEVGEQFTCYALKPESLVIALRATIGSQRLVELELLVDQLPTTTTTAPAATTG
jgi:hypothetical protein